MPRLGLLRQTFTDSGSPDEFGLKKQTEEPGRQSKSRRENCRAKGSVSVAIWAGVSSKLLPNVD
jgi:hypothetical protein